MNALALKKLLAENLAALIDHEAGDGARMTHEAVAAKARVGLGTVGRVARAEVAPRVDTLEAIAGVFGLRGWQLLIGPLDPAAPPALLTAALQEELTELRALRRMVEGWADGRREPDTRQGDAANRAPHEEKQAGRRPKGSD